MKAINIENLERETYEFYFHYSLIKYHGSISLFSNRSLNEIFSRYYYIVFKENLCLKKIQLTDICFKIFIQRGTFHCFTQRTNALVLTAIAVIFPKLLFLKERKFRFLFQNKMLCLFNFTM